MKKAVSRIYMGLVMFFLYAPIFVMIVFSFNSSKSRAVWQGFSTKWYEALFNDQTIMNALGMSLLVAVLAALVSTVLGTMAAIGLRALGKKTQTLMMSVNNIPMVNPEIVTGISMMLMFVVVFRATGLLKPGFATLLLSHITFCLPYVILSILPKLRQMNPHLFEAAQDLGCTPLQA
ncbi:MAG: ABC transporter permease subunit, partial [Ruminococcaceae bacterium]|nr:ABC transporter permease subunit [Oscillospiraceae bacterium]